MDGLMRYQVEVPSPDGWSRIRDIRLASLRADPDAFGASYEEQSRWTEGEWRSSMATHTYLVVGSEEGDCAVMFIRLTDEDPDATCWVGGCWTRPNERGHGHLRRLFTYVDENAQSHGWQRQGLGVWTHNHGAIGAYERLGFERRAGEIESTSHPGWFYYRLYRETFLR